MEIGLKERLIGAAVLVILGVIIIPFFLKGSSPDSGVAQQVTLPPAAGTAAAQQYTMSLAPGSGTATLAPAASTQAPALQAAAAVEPKPVVHNISRQQAAPVAEGKWVIQAGSYGSEANAEKVAHTLEQRGYRAAVSRFSKGGQTYYRVRVGPYAERSAADKAAPAVARAYGGKAEVVPNT